MRDEWGAISQRENPVGFEYSKLALVQRSN